MKTNILIIAIAGIFSLSACSQDIPESEIPSVVRNALALEFTSATEVEWDKNGSFYEVEFEIDNIDHKALIGENGTLVKYHKELLFEELPEGLKSSLKADTEITKIDEVHLLIISENTYYQVEIEGPITDSQKIYNEAGEEVQGIIYYE